MFEICGYKNCDKTVVITFYNSSIIKQLIVTIGYNSGSTIAVVTTYPYAIPTKAIQVEVLGSR
jgi:hypothetical protein